MINPLRSEEEAFKLTIWIAVLAAPVALTAVLFGGGVALGVAGGLAFAGFLVVASKRRDEKPERVSVRRPEGDPRHRILVVANETLSGQALADEIAYRSGGKDAAVFVVCPALNTRVRHWTNEEDAARAEAGKRVDEMLTRLSTQGLVAEGDVGEDDPVQAMEDALRLFRADEAIISTHPLGRSNWLEADVIGRARERFNIPITHVIIDLEREREFVAERM